MRCLAVLSMLLLAAGCSVAVQAPQELVRTVLGSELVVCGGAVVGVVDRYDTNGKPGDGAELTVVTDTSGQEVARIVHADGDGGAMIGAVVRGRAVTPGEFGALFPGPCSLFRGVGG